MHECTCTVSWKSVITPYTALYQCYTYIVLENQLIDLGLNDLILSLHRHHKSVSTQQYPQSGNYLCTVTGWVCEPWEADLLTSGIRSQV